jgi:hypothetical protein
MNSPWIRKTDKLPEEGQEVLIADKFQGFAIAALCMTKDGPKWEHEDHDGPSYSDLDSWDFWMPIPTPPSE